MNPRTTVYLLVALIVVGVGFFMLYPNEPLPPTTTGIEKAMFSRVEFDPEGLHTVHVKWSDGRDATIERDADGNWMQAQPVRFPLHRMKMELGVAVTAATLMYTDRFKEGDAGKPTLKETGLDQPEVVITFTGDFHELDEDKKKLIKKTPYEQKIAIGKTTIGGRGYVRVNDSDDIYVVNRDLHDVLLRDAIQEWRIKQLIAPTEAQAQRISLNVEGESFALRKESGDEWVLEPPHDGRVNPLVIKALMQALSQVTIARFEDEDPKNMALFGLDEPRIEFVIETPQSQMSIKKRTLRIGAPADAKNLSYYATWSQEESENRVVFTILKNARIKFMLKVNELRDPRISLARPKDVLDVKVQRGDGTKYALEKSATEGWTFAKNVSAPKYQPDGTAVGRLVEALTQPLAFQYHPNADRDADPLAIVQVSTGPTKEETLKVMPKPDDLIVAGGEKVYMVLRNDETTGYLVRQEELAPLFEPMIKLRDREVLTLDPKKFSRIAIKRWDGLNYLFQGRRRPGDDHPTNWILAGHDELEANALAQLMGALSKVRCDTWLEGPATIGDRAIDIEITFSDMAPVKMTVDTETGHANFAGLEHGIVMPRPFVNLIASEFRYRSVLPISNQDIETVTVKVEDAKSLTIQRDDVGRFNAIGPDGQPVPGIKLNFAVAAKLYDALAPLRVIRYIDPLEVDEKDAMLTITVKTKSLKTHVAYIGFNDDPKVGKVSDLWFRISDETAVQLFSDSTKAQGRPR